MDTFHLPRNTFTSFRLSYLSIDEISETSKCLVLGKVPSVWLEDENAGILSGSIRVAKDKAKASLKDSVNKINNTSSSTTDNWKGSGGKIRRWEKLLVDVKGQILEDETESEFDSDSDSESESEPEPGPNFGSEGSFSGSTWNNSLHLSKNHTLDAIRPIASGINNVSKPSDRTNNLISDDTLKQEHLKVSNVIQNNRNHKSQKNESSSNERLHVEIAAPIPFTEVHEELTADERKKHKLRQRLKTIAKSSRGNAIKRTNDFGHRIYKSLIKNFAVGETIMKEKVLILTKETLSTQSFEKFEENEPCDTRVTERWQEYYLVITKGQNDIVLQFYKISDDEIENSTNNERPSFEKCLNSNVKISFYSLIDKSICIAYPLKNWMTINIVKFNTQRKSIKWLYFLKQVIGDIMDSVFSIFVPEVDVSVDILVSDADLIDMIIRPPFLEVHQLNKGYKAIHTPLIQYILDKVIDSLKNNTSTLEWLLRIENPWLCFRHYDHIEWIVDDSELFLIQNQVLKDSFVLEFRDMTTGKRYLESDSPLIVEPLPIEGFLSRITTASGNEIRYLRTFYKVLYFSTVDNLLFFGKYYRGVPPVFTSQVSEDIYEHCSYCLNESGHVDWFNTSEFKSKDEKCLEEFLRRSMHINKADSVMDLTLIIDIRPVPLSDIKLAHKVLLGVLWYGNPKVTENEFIADSVFEITTQNFGKIRLQAPNRLIRDEWIKRLNNIREYWNLKKQDEIERIVSTRTKNMEMLQIDEYIDSNIKLETNINQIKHSRADPFVNSIDSISLTNSITMSGYLYQKYKKHSNFNQYFVVLNSGLMILYSIYTRSKVTGEWKRIPYFHKHLTIPLTSCYVYSGLQTEFDLLERSQTVATPGISSLPRVYGDGWKSQEEEANRCFTIWFGKKRNISKTRIDEPKNPGLAKLIRKLGITGQSIVFMARSRQERELWVTRIHRDIDRYTILYNID